MWGLSNLLSSASITCPVGLSTPRGHVHGPLGLLRTLLSLGTLLAKFHSLGSFQGPASSLHDQPHPHPPGLSSDRTHLVSWWPAVACPSLGQVLGVCTTPGPCWPAHWSPSARASLWRSPAFGGHQVSLAGLAPPSRIAAAGGWGRSVARLGSASIVTAVWNLSFRLYNRDRASSVSISFTHLSLSEKSLVMSDSLRPHGL